MTATPAVAFKTFPNESDQYRALRHDTLVLIQRSTDHWRSDDESEFPLADPAHYEELAELSVRVIAMRPGREATTFLARAFELSDMATRLREYNREEFNTRRLRKTIELA